MLKKSERSYPKFKNVEIVENLNSQKFWEFWKEALIQNFWKEAAKSFLESLAPIETLFIKKFLMAPKSFGKSFLILNWKLGNEFSNLNKTLKQNLWFQTT